MPRQLYCYYSFVFPSFIGFPCPQISEVIFFFLKSLIPLFNKIVTAGLIRGKIFSSHFFFHSTRIFDIEFCLRGEKVLFPNGVFLKEGCEENNGLT